MIEALVALVILAFALAGIVELFLNSQAQSRRNANRIQLSLLARQQLEELKGAGFEAIDDYFRRTAADGNRAFYPAEPTEIGPRGGFWAITQIERESDNAYRLKIALKAGGPLTARRLLGAEADYTLTALIQGGAQ
ncbi:MAG: hypothetical protein Kow0059_16210 [Candidatus Sumerlaeia bacterium]